MIYFKANRICNKVIALHDILTSPPNVEDRGRFQDQCRVNWIYER